MVYKSFKHQKISISTYTLLLKKQRYIRFRIHFKIARLLSLSVSGDSRSGSRDFRSDLCYGPTIEWTRGVDFLIIERRMKGSNELHSDRSFKGKFLSFL
ncbi:hypothetical protein Hanom_Chr05g00474541 [Helianthus anomalus]